MAQRAGFVLVVLATFTLGALLVPLFGRFLRNCLENSWTGLDRVVLVAQSEDKGASGSLLLTHGTSAWGPFGFSTQFLRNCVENPKHGLTALPSDASSPRR
jgi:hypothetical protein